MIHPEKLTHNGIDYTLSHLQKRVESFSWVGKSQESSVYSVKLSFSNHCYSEEIKNGRTIKADDLIVSDSPSRVFCPIRYRETPILVGLMRGLIEKPTSRIALTAKTTGGSSNWKIYKLYTRLDDGGPGRYTVFFSIRRGANELIDGKRKIDVYVESAYLKEKKVPVITNMAFGLVSEMVWLGKSVR